MFNALLPTDAGEYWVHVTNPNAPLLTLKSHNITLVVQPDLCAALIGLSILPQNQVLCQGSNTILNSGVWNEYTWSTGATTATLTVSSAGQYQITVTNADGCTVTDTVAVTVNSAPVLNNTTIPAACGQTNGSINLTATGAGMPFSYVWSNNATTEDLGSVSAGNYTVTVTDLNGCTSTSIETVTMESITTPQITGSTSIVPGDTSTLSVLGLYDTYEWSDGSSDTTIQIVLSGTYTVTVSLDACTATAEITVVSDLEDILDNAASFIPKSVTPNGDGMNDFFDPLQVLLDNGYPLQSAKARMTVFARSGEVLYTLDPYPTGGWGGDNAPIAPAVNDGAYYYILEFTFADGAKARYKGSVNLVR